MSQIISLDVLKILRKRDPWVPRVTQFQNASTVSYMEDHSFTGINMSTILDLRHNTDDLGTRSGLPWVNTSLTFGDP